MEIGFYIGLGLWLTLMAIDLTIVEEGYRIVPMKVIVAAIVFIGLPTFWGGVIEWGLS